MRGKWQPETMPTLVISRIARQLTRLVDQRLKPLGLTASQLPVLVALKHGEKRTQKDLVLAAGVEQSSMAQLLARMERDGLIRREPSPDDRRSSLITLTDHALSLLEPGRDALRRIDEDACAGLPGTDRTALLAMLADVAGRIVPDGST
jgi:DNA-binding MarR family transcriptional regulator